MCIGGGGDAPEDGHVSAHKPAFAAPVLRGGVQAWTTWSSGRGGPQRVQNVSLGTGAPCKHRSPSSVFLHPSSGQLREKVSIVVTRLLVHGLKKANECCIFSLVYKPL